VFTVHEVPALSGKIKESKDLIDKIETTSMAQVEAINIRKNEVNKKWRQRGNLCCFWSRIGGEEHNTLF